VADLLCQAEEMAELIYGSSTHPCLSTATVLMDTGHQLCGECASALRVVQAIELEENEEGND